MSHHESLSLSSISPVRRDDGRIRDAIARIIDGLDMDREPSSITDGLDTLETSMDFRSDRVHPGTALYLDLSMVHIAWTAPEIPVFTLFRVKRVEPGGNIRCYTVLPGIERIQEVILIPSDDGCIVSISLSSPIYGKFGYMNY